MKTDELVKKCYRVRRSVNPNSHVILAERGVRQVLFPYVVDSHINLINLSIRESVFYE